MNRKRQWIMDTFWIFVSSNKLHTKHISGFTGGYTGVCYYELIPAFQCLVMFWVTCSAWFNWVNECPHKLRDRICCKIQSTVFVKYLTTKNGWRWIFCPIHFAHLFSLFVWRILRPIRNDSTLLFLLLLFLVEIIVIHSSLCLKACWKRVPWKLIDGGL